TPRDQHASGGQVHPPRISQGLEAGVARGYDSQLADATRTARICVMMNTAESPPTPLRGAKLWPLSVAAYRALGEAGLIPKNTELLSGLVSTKMPKAPFATFLVVRLLRLLGAVVPPTHLVRSEQPITCPDSEPE